MKRPLYEALGTIAGIIYSASRDAVHTYHQAGTYTASMTVSDDQGHVVSDEIEVTVDAAPAAALPSPPDTPEVDEPPVVTLLAEPTTGMVPVTTNFTARAADPEGEALTYTWTFAPGVVRGGGPTESYTTGQLARFRLK